MSFGIGRGILGSGIAVGFLSMILGGPVEGPDPSLFQAFPRVTGYGDFQKISDKTPREASPAADGSGVLLRSATPGSSGNDLDYHFGVNFSQKLEILSNEASLFSLGAKGMERGGEIIFSFIRGNRLNVLSIPQQASPQGDPFAIHEVSAETNFWSCDHFVTPEGVVLVLGYYTSNVYKPRLFRAEGNLDEFQEIDLGLSGVYLDAIFGAPRMRLVPYLYDGNLICIWAIRQFTQQQNTLVLLEVDLDLATPLGTGSIGTAGPLASAISLKEIANLPIPRRSFPDGNEETAASPLGVVHDEAASYIYFDDLNANAAVYHPRTGASLVRDLGCFLDDVRIEQETVSAEFGRGHGAVLNIIAKSGGNEFSGTVRTGEGSGTWEDAASEVVWYQREVQHDPGQSEQGWIGSLGGPLHFDRFWFFTRNMEGAANVFGVRPALLAESRIAPQLVQGATSLQFVNTSRWSLKAEYYFTKQDGEVFQSGELELDPHGSSCVDVQGDLLQPGAGFVFSDFPLEVQATWKLSNYIQTPNAGGSANRGSTEWVIPVNNNSESLTGVAAVNAYSSSNSCDVTIYDEFGTMVAWDTPVLGPGEQQAFFPSDRFGGLDTFKGAMFWDCDHPIGLTGATQESSGAIVLVPGNVPRKFEAGLHFNF